MRRTVAVIGFCIALLLAGATVAVSWLEPPLARAAATGDDYPAQWRNIPMDSVFDSWGEYNRECTSAVAWWLHERNGFEMPFHDNANGWGHDASVRGYAVNGTPAVGAIAWWGPGDHVAWVAAVSGGSVTIEEYNHDLQGHYSERVIAAGAPSGYIHFKDIASGPGGPSWPPAEGSFISHASFVYRIAGGAPVYVSNWAAVGGPQPSTPLNDGQFASLPQFPRDGTILDSSGGGVFIAAGGAPLYLSNWNAIGGPKPGVVIDQAAIDNAGGGVPWDHLRSYPADGTILDSSGGGVFIAAGGAPLYLSNWNAIGGPQPGVVVDQWDIDHAGTHPAAHLRLYPADGTLVATSGDGRVYEIVGGAPLYVSNWGAIGGPRAATGIDQWDVDHTDNPASHLRQYPVDGTFINTSLGQVYRVAGGTPFPLSSWSLVGGVQPYVSMDQWDVDHTADPHAHLRASPLDGTIVKGLPSNQYWAFSGGLRGPEAVNSRAVAVDDLGLSLFPQRQSSIPVVSHLAATSHLVHPAPPRRRHHLHRKKRHRHRHHHRKKHRGQWVRAAE
ncbi:MAG TPA: CHAP domain-containing protein [Solirubrobacterales bacterium]